MGTARLFYHCPDPSLTHTYYEKQLPRIYFWVLPKCHHIRNKGQFLWYHKAMKTPQCSNIDAMPLPCVSRYKGLLLHKWQSQQFLLRTNNHEDHALQDQSAPTVLFVYAPCISRICSLHFNWNWPAKEIIYSTQVWQHTYHCYGCTQKVCRTSRQKAMSCADTTPI